MNIQDNDNFSSHRLNRDTWSDKTVTAIVHSNFVFWQRGSTSLDGRDYLNKYKVAVSCLPRISILDPRTGAELLEIMVSALGPRSAPPMSSYDGLLHINAYFYLLLPTPYSFTTTSPHIHYRAFSPARSSR